MIELSFLGVPNVNAWIFFGLSIAACFTSIVAVVTGTAGGLLLLALMAFFFDPATLLPLHTVIMLLASVHVAALFWRYILRQTVIPFLGGSIIGAALGAQIFVELRAARQAHAVVARVGEGIVQDTRVSRTLQPDVVEHDKKLR